MSLVGIYSTLTQASNNSIQELLFYSTFTVYVNQPMGFVGTCIERDIVERF